MRPLPNDHPAWADAFPDPAVRRRWQARFRGNPTAAQQWAQHYTDPAAAARWADTWILPEFAAYLDTHNIGFDEDRIAKALHDAEEEPRVRAGLMWHRAALILAHPHLTETDRTIILRTSLSMREIDQALADGTYDPGTFTVLGGLT